MKSLFWSGVWSFLFSTAIVMVIWSIISERFLFHCSDRMWATDFIPPFVHSGFGDYYLASPATVFTVWGLLIVLIFLVASLILVAKFYKK